MPPETATFVACLATILELPPAEIPEPQRGEDPARGWTIMRWLGGRALGLVAIERYASRPVLRALVHRGGLRADIVEDGTIAVGETVVVSA